MDDRLAEFGSRAAAATRRASLDAALGSVTRALADAEVPCLLLKGAAVAGWLYESGEDRPYDDLDLLVGAGVAAPDRARLATLAGRVGLGEAGPGELAGHAARRAAAWRSYASWGSPPERSDAADAVHRGWARVWGELTG